MKLLTALVVFGVLVAALAFEEEDSHERSKRHLQKCDEHSECQAGSCCDRVYFFGKWCRKQKREGARCYPDSSKCRNHCAEGLECVEQGSASYCAQPQPTEEPGSGDVDFF